MGKGVAYLFIMSGIWIALGGALEVLALMDDGDVGQVPVVRDGQLLGLIGRDHLLRVIRAHLEFRA